jgi:FkbM family methyltransferase
MNYTSQHGEDKWIVENLKLPEKGVFVEVGAYTGIAMSNTYHFEQKGWTGLCIEADPRHWGQLLMNRQCQKFFGAAGSNPDLAFSMNPESSWSGFGRDGVSVKVPVLGLWDLCYAYGINKMDLLSLDTEGTELDVFSTLYPEIEPAIVIIEWETAGLPSNEQRIKDYFAPLPYQLVHRNVGNMIFERTYA